MQVEPIRPTFKAPGTKRLKLKCGELLSSFAFNVDLRRFTKAWCPRLHDAVAAWSFKSYAEFLQRRRHYLLALSAALTLVRRCRLTLSNPR